MHDRDQILFRRAPSLAMRGGGGEGGGGASFLFLPDSHATVNHHRRGYDCRRHWREPRHILLFVLCRWSDGSQSWTANTCRAASALADFLSVCWTPSAFAVTSS